MANRPSPNWQEKCHLSGQIIATSANGGLVRESLQNPLNSGLGIIVICPDLGVWLRLPAGAPVTADRS